MKTVKKMKRVHWYYKFLIVFIIFFSMFFLLNKNISNIVNNSSYKNSVNILAKPFIFFQKCGTCILGNIIHK